jgi:hypothetical protein
VLADTNICFGSLADIRERIRDVRFILKADMPQVCINVCKVLGLAVATHPRSPTVRDEEVDVRLSPPKVEVLCSGLLDC